MYVPTIVCPQRTHQTIPLGESWNQIDSLYQHTLITVFRNLQTMLTPRRRQQNNHKQSHNELTLSQQRCWSLNAAVRECVGRKIVTRAYHLSKANTHTHKPTHTHVHTNTSGALHSRVVKGSCSGQ